jgi:hypothetical protein
LVNLSVLPVLLSTLLASAPVAAGPVENAAAALRADSVYLDPGSNRNLDVAALREAIGSEPIKIAVIPRIESVSQVAALPRRLAVDLPGNTIAVISGRYFYAGSEVICKGQAGQAAANAINANEAALDQNNTADSPSDITKPLTDFVAAVKAAPKCPEEAGRADRYADEPGGGVAAGGPDDTATVLPWVLGGIGIGVLVIGAFALLTRRRTRTTAAHRREETHDLVRRLEAELDTLPTDVTGEAAEARMEAAGEHGEAEAILLGATTDAQFSAARHAAIKGLRAARQARLALGLDAGPDIPELGSDTEPDLGSVRVPDSQAAAESDRR